MIDNKLEKNQSMTQFIEKLKNVSENPYLNLIVAFLALCSGIFEVIYELQVSEDIRFGAHHGIVLFAFLHILKTIPHLYASMIKLNGTTNIENVNDPAPDTKDIGPNQKK